MSSTSNDPLATDVAELLERTNSLLSEPPTRTLSETGPTRGSGRFSPLAGSIGRGLAPRGDALSEAASRLRTSLDSASRKKAYFKEPLSVHVPRSTLAFSLDAVTPRLDSPAGRAAPSVALTDTSLYGLERSASMTLPSGRPPQYNSFAGLQDIVSAVDAMVGSAPSSPPRLGAGGGGVGGSGLGGRLGTGLSLSSGSLLGVGGGGGGGARGSPLGLGLGLGQGGGLRPPSRLGSPALSPRSPLRRGLAPTARAASPTSKGSRRSQLAALLSKDFAQPYEVAKFKSEQQGSNAVFRPPASTTELAGSLEEQFDRINRKLKSWGLIESVATERFNSAMEAALDDVFARVTLTWAPDDSPRAAASGRGSTGGQRSARRAAAPAPGASRGGPPQRQRHPHKQHGREREREGGGRAQPPAAAAVARGKLQTAVQRGGGGGRYGGSALKNGYGGGNDDSASNVSGSGSGDSGSEGPSGVGEWHEVSSSSAIWSEGERGGKERRRKEQPGRRKRGGRGAGSSDNSESGSSSSSTDGERQAGGKRGATGRASGGARAGGHGRGQQQRAAAGGRRGGAGGGESRSKHNRDATGVRGGPQGPPQGRAGRPAAGEHAQQAAAPAVPAPPPPPRVPSPPLPGAAATIGQPPATYVPGPAPHLAYTYGYSHGQPPPYAAAAGPAPPAGTAPSPSYPPHTAPHTYYPNYAPQHAPAYAAASYYGLPAHVQPGGSTGGAYPSSPVHAQHRDSTWAPGPQPQHRYGGAVGVAGHAGLDAAASAGSWGTQPDQFPDAHKGPHGYGAQQPSAGSGSWGTAAAMTGQQQAPQQYPNHGASTPSYGGPGSPRVYGALPPHPQPPPPLPGPPSTGPTPWQRPQEQQYGGPAQYGSAAQVLPLYGSAAQGPPQYGSAAQGPPQYGSAAQGPPQYGQAGDGNGASGPHAWAAQAGALHSGYLGEFSYSASSQSPTQHSTGVGRGAAVPPLALHSHHLYGVTSNGAGMLAMASPPQSVPDRGAMSYSQHLRYAAVGR